MRDSELLYWGMVVTMFLMIAALLTARELFEMYLDKRASERSDEHGGKEPAGR